MMKSPRSWGHLPLQGTLQGEVGSRSDPGGGLATSAESAGRRDPHPAPEPVIGPAKGRTRWTPPSPFQGEGKRKRPHLSGRANTHSTEPPSGIPISGVSVLSDRISLEPLPVATATYCLPLAV